MKVSILITVLMTWILTCPVSAMSCIIHEEEFNEDIPEGVRVVVVTTVMCFGGFGGSSGTMEGGGGEGEGGGTNEPDPEEPPPPAINCDQFVNNFRDIVNYSRIEHFGIPRTSTGEPHKGTDLFVPNGTPIYSPCDGILREMQDQVPRDFNIANNGPSAFVGNSIAIEPDGGYTGLNANPGAAIRVLLDHMDPGFINQLDLYTGQHIRKGQLIGYSDNTGSTNIGPHLHVQLKTMPDGDQDLATTLNCGE